MKQEVTIILFLYSTVLNSAAAEAGQESSAFFFSDDQKNEISLVNKTPAWQPEPNLTGIVSTKNDTPRSSAIYNISNDGINTPENSSDLNWNSTAEDWSNHHQHLSLEGQVNGTVFTPTNVMKSHNTETLNDTLRNYLPDIGYTVDIFTMAEILRGVVSDINLRRQSQVKIDPTNVTNAGNGIDALTNLLVSLQAYYLLDEVLDRNLNCGENLMRVIAQLGGNLCNGVTGRARAMYELFTSGDTECKDGLNQSNSLEWNQSVKGLNNVTRNLGPNFQGMKDFVQRMGRH